MNDARAFSINFCFIQIIIHSLALKQCPDLMFCATFSYTSLQQRDVKWLVLDMQRTLVCCVQALSHIHVSSSQQRVAAGPLNVRRNDFL